MSQQQHEPTSLALLDQETDRILEKIDKRAETFAMALKTASAFGQLRRAAILAMGIQELGKALDQKVMGLFMSLMNTQLGFKTDRGPGTKQAEPYPVDVVKQCVIAALLSGLYPVGNEFNILAGRMYITKEGYYRKVCEIDGLTDLVLAPGVPALHNGQMVCRVGATWKLHGQPGKLVDGEGKPGRAFPIIVTQYSSPDQNIGKATRKALKAIYDQVTGTVSTPDLDDDVVTPPVTSSQAPPPAPQVPDAEFTPTVGASPGEVDPDLAAEDYLNQIAAARTTQELDQAVAAAEGDVISIGNERLDAVKRAAAEARKALTTKAPRR